MKNSAAKFVLAVLATALAGSPLFAAPEAEPAPAEKEKPADTCLLGPSASTPPGGHWYYRIDRANKRNCWYLGDAKGKAARKPAVDEEAAAAEKPALEKPVAAKPAAPAKKPVAQRAVTDARAEWQSQRAVEPESRPAAVKPWPGAAIADAPSADETQKPATTRWPELAAASPSVIAPAPPAPLAQNSTPLAVQSQPQNPPTVQTALAAPALRAAVPPPAAKPAPRNDEPMSWPMLLTALVAGLSVIGVLVSAMFGGRRKSRAKPQLSRSVPMPSLEEIPEPHAEHARSEPAYVPEAPTRSLQEMLAEIQKRAAA